MFIYYVLRLNLPDDIINFGWFHVLFSIFSSIPFFYILIYSYDWSGQMYVTGSNDGHVFVCDARVSNNFKVVGHLGTEESSIFSLLLFYLINK